ncbi:MAG: HNH endonuclease [Leptothrix sp. (in: b-proteobacteria)]
MTKSRHVNKPRFAWTDEQTALLIKLYPTTPACKIAPIIGCRIEQVYSKVSKMNLRKNPAFFSTPASGRTTGLTGRDTRFKPGSVPWNTGKKGLRYSLATEFKAGNTPHNAKPIGTFRITQDGVLEVKAREGHGMRNWVAYARVIWERAHGPIPHRHVVSFIDGSQPTDPALVTADKLVCRSYRDNMLRNSVHTNYPPELVAITQLRAVLTRQINKRTKAKNEQEDQRPA